ncbi:MAG: preprotein translocase subunit SecA, partial [Actinomycetota bacterium]|nr:preprotein translocase subunit SecA [Actinomycetota bacterium]
GVPGAITIATNMAGRGTDIQLGGNADMRIRQEITEIEDPREREKSPRADEIRQQVARLKEKALAAGGLYVLGTERHESRRIDNQLRGRSGRQGDPGHSRFYLSLGDDLMRRFNGPMLESMMTSLRVPDDQPIESKMVTRAIRSAQTQVEGQNFEVRKDVLKYDEVLNRQRTVIYEERRQVLEGADLHEQLRHMVDDVVEGYVTAATSEGYAEEWDLEQLWAALKTLYPVSLTIEALEEASGGDRSGLSGEYLAEELKADAQAAYDRREETLGAEVMRELERRVVLSVLDRKWREHLYEMDYLQEGIGLRAMAQRDPLVEYQREGFNMFSAMMDAIKEESVGYVFNLEVQQVEQDDEGDEGEDGAQPHHAEVVAKGLEAPKRPARLQYSAPTVDGDAAASAQPVVRDGEGEYADVPRNAPCPCGSGKKFKRCHGDPRTRTS